MRQKFTIADIEAPVIRVEPGATATEFRVAPARRTRLRLGGVVALTTVAVLVLYVALSRDMSASRGQTLLVGVHAVPALVTFALGWRLRDFRRALASAALVMLSVTVAMLVYVATQLGLEYTLRGMFTEYAARELARFVGIGLAAGVAGAGVRRLARRHRGGSLDR